MIREGSEVGTHRLTWLLALLLICILVVLAVVVRRGSGLAGTTGSDANAARQLVLGCLVYADNHDGSWPRDLAEMQREVGLSPQSLRSTGCPQIRDPFCYLRPQAGASPMQPVLVENPACLGGTTVIIAYADGHLMISHDLSQWDRAVKLAASSQPTPRRAGPTDRAPEPPAAAEVRSR